MQDLIWYIPGRFRVLSRMGRAIVLAVDTSPASTAALEWTLRNLLDRSDDVLHLVHCFTPLKPVVGALVSFHPSGARTSDSFS